MQNPQVNGVVMIDKDFPVQEVQHSLLLLHATLPLPYQWVNFFNENSIEGWEIG